MDRRNTVQIGVGDVIIAFDPDEARRLNGHATPLLLQVNGLNVSVQLHASEAASQLPVYAIAAPGLPDYTTRVVTSEFKQVHRAIFEAAPDTEAAAVKRSRLIQSAGYGESSYGDTAVTFLYHRGKLKRTVGDKYWRDPGINLDGIAEDTTP